MDIDLEFSDDKVEFFLTTKLEEISLKNESLETVLNQHKNTLKCPSDDNIVNTTSFKVIEDWRRICFNKYSIGYVIFTVNEKEYEDITLFLTWDSKETFSYKVETFSVIPASKENCKEATNCNLIIDTVKKESNAFRGKTYLIVVFDVPQYLHKLEYEISGSFTCSLEGTIVNSPLPKVNISAKDGTQSSYWISQNYLQNIFSIISCSHLVNLVMILPEEWTVSLISTFEIHCALTHLKVSVSCKSYFVANDVSKLFDSALLAIHSDHNNSNTLFLTVYAASNDQIYALCHHLGLCLPNIVFFPLSYYATYLCRNASFSKELLQEFGRSMRQELELSHKFSQGSSSHSNKEIIQFRSCLCKIQSDTDKLFLKISNMKY